MGLFGPFCIKRAPTEHPVGQTPGLSCTGELGSLWVQRTHHILPQALAVTLSPTVAFDGAAWPHGKLPGRSDERKLLGKLHKVTMENCAAC